MESFRASCIDKTQAEAPSFVPHPTPATYPLLFFIHVRPSPTPRPLHLLLPLPGMFFSSRFTPWPPLGLQSNATCSWGHPWPILTLEHYYSPFALYFYPWHTSPSHIFYKSCTFLLSVGVHWNEASFRQRLLSVLFPAPATVSGTS